jgi:hypothetical protein
MGHFGLGWKATLHVDWADPTALLLDHYEQRKER